MAKILVVDDSPVIVASLKAALTQEGFEVLTASDGVDAIQQASLHQPDLVVLDVMMPRMNGYQTCRLLKTEEATRHLPVIFLTTQSAKHNVFWGTQAGGVEYFSKSEVSGVPVEHISKDEGWPAVVRAVKAHLNGHPATHGKRREAGSTVDVLTRLNTLLDEQLFESTLINQISAAVGQLADYRTAIRTLFTTLARVVDYDVIGLVVLGGKQGYCTVGGPAHLTTATVERYHEQLLKRFQTHRPTAWRQRPLITERVTIATGYATAATSAATISGTTWPSWFVLPLKSRGTVIGLLGIASQRPDAFGPEIERLLQAVGPPLTAVVDNARLYRELGELSATLQQRVERLAMLFALSGRLLAAKQLPKLFTEILQICFKAIQADSGSVMLVEQGRTLRVAASVGLKRRVMKQLRVVMIGDRIAGWVAKHRRPLLLVGGLKSNRQFAHLKSRAEIKSSIVVPMLVKRKLIGVLNLNRTRSANRFTKEDIELASTLANHAALAVEQMRLHQKLQTSYAEVRQVKSQLIQSEKLAALGHLASAMAHEIDNPLAIISGIAQLMLEEVREQPTWVENLQRIVAQTDRASDIIERLLRFAKPSPPVQREPVDVNAAVQDALFLVQRQLAYEKVQVVTRLAADLPPVMGNANQLQEVCLNLVINAFEAMPEGGTLRIETERQVHPTHVVIRFADSGPGIRPDLQPRIFEPFFTTKERGKGLGLFVTHQIVSSHGGLIRIKSQVGKGATFAVHLPVATSAGGVRVQKDSGR